MVIHITVQNETRELEKIPETLYEFQKLIYNLFPKTLPQRYRIAYYDIHSIKRTLDKQDEFPNFVFLTEILNPMKIEVEDVNSDRNNDPKRDFFGMVPEEPTKNQGAPGPYRKRAIDLSSERPIREFNKGSRMTDEGSKINPQLIGSEESKLEDKKKTTPQKVIIKEEDDISSKFKLRAEIRNMLLTEVPFLANLIGSFLGETEFIVNEPSDEENPGSRKNLLPKAANSNYISSKRQTKTTVHKNARCSVCGVFPIVGARYCSTMLEDFDMCENCEEAVDHPYPLIKLHQESENSPNKVTPKARRKTAKLRKGYEEAKDINEKKTPEKSATAGLFSNLCLDDVGHMAGKIIQEDPKEASPEMKSLLEKFSKFKIKSSSTLFDEELPPKQSKAEKSHHKQQQQQQHHYQRSFHSQRRKKSMMDTSEENDAGFNSLFSTHSQRGGTMDEELISEMRN